MQKIFYKSDFAVSFVPKDAEGNAIAQATGAISGETLQRGIDLIYTP